MSEPTLRLTRADPLRDDPALAEVLAMQERLLVSLWARLRRETGLARSEADRGEIARLVDRVNRYQRRLGPWKSRAPAGLRLGRPA